MYLDEEIKSNYDCFNRYMVECEYLMSVVTTVIEAIVLIDTWWNVNRCADALHLYA